MLPLAPILYKYLVVHRRNAFFRGIGEIRSFSADLGAVMCAPELMTFWGWLRTACRPEGELFPGVTVMVLFAVGLLIAVGARHAGGSAPAGSISGGRSAMLLRRLFAVVAIFYLSIAISLIVLGPWRLELAGMRATATSLRRPLSLGLPALFLVMALTPGIRDTLRRQWTLVFYLLGTVLMWLCALGPNIFYMGRDTSAVGPFLALMQLPGADGLRVPARFWIIAVLGLSVVAGLVTARLAAARNRPLARALVAVAAVAILADGWVTVLPVATAPVLPVPAVTLAGRTVMELPIGDTLDIPSTYFAATGGWRMINGYSGYHPSYYPALNYAVRFEEGTAFEPFRALGDLDVLVSSKAGRLRALVENQPGVRVVTQNEQAIHYVLPQSGSTEAGDTAGQQVPVASALSSCGAQLMSLATDKQDATRWVCGPENVARSVLIDLGRVTTVGAVVNGIGQFNGDFPPALTAETSTDGTSWQPAWDGSLLAQAIRGGLRSPASQRIVIPFTPRPARYIRLTHPAAKDYYWSIAELEVWSAHS